MRWGHKARSGRLGGGRWGFALRNAGLASSRARGGALSYLRFIPSLTLAFGNPRIKGIPGDGIRPCWPLTSALTRASVRLLNCPPSTTQGGTSGVTRRKLSHIGKQGGCKDSGERLLSDLPSAIFESKNLDLTVVKEGNLSRQDVGRKGPGKQW